MPNSEIAAVEPPRSILVGVELRDADYAVATAAACAYAGVLGAEVILAGVAPLAEPVLTNGAMDMAPPMVAPIAEQEAIDRVARQQLEEAAAGVPDGVACRTVLTWGPLGPALVDVAETEGADLITMPMRRAGPVGHLLHDGADRYVLHHSPVPVLIVPVAHDHPHAA